MSYPRNQTESLPDRNERVVHMADCYTGLQFGDRGTVVAGYDLEKLVRFDRDGSERWIITSSLGTEEQRVA